MRNPRTSQVAETGHAGEPAAYELEALQFLSHGAATRLANGVKRPAGLEEFIGESPLLLEVMEKTRRAAACNVNVLICGETGTGKEICARAIHLQSARSGKLLVVLNCALTTPELVESTLFGHMAGAY